MRAYNGHIFRLDRHLTRLCRSAQSLGLARNVIAMSRSPEYKEGEAKQSLETACRETLKANKLKDARLRLTISAGEGDMTPAPGTCSGLTILVTAKNFVPLPPQRYEQGFKAALSSVHRNSQSPLSRLKSTCYLENILARTEANLKWASKLAPTAGGVDEAIMLNERGHLAEGSISNIFLVSQGMLITPSLESGVLPGITREAVLEIAQASNIKAVEREVELKELTLAGEALITNSILEIMPLTSFDGKPIGAGKPGELTKNLMAAYRKLVNTETEVS